jgi:hypothetical protein
MTGMRLLEIEIHGAHGIVSGGVKGAVEVFLL